MGRGGFGKGKYKKIIKSIYPVTPDGDVQVHNIGKLVHFCQISPTKLIKVASYVEKKTNSDLTKSKLRFVGVSMKIFQDLIKGCRKNLNLFSNNILRLIKILLECSFPKLKIVAAETFIQFTDVLDENTPYPELEGLISYLIDMCQNQFRDLKVRTRLKQDGLKSIRAYIRVLEMTDELDGFIARYTDEENWSVLLPAILDNLSFPVTSATESTTLSHPPSTPSTSNSTLFRDPSVITPQPLHNTSHLTAPLGIQTNSAESDPPEPHVSSSHQMPVGADSLEPQLLSPLVDIDGESVNTLATEVLRDIFSRANISITSMFKAILRYLEFRQRWIPNSFAIYVIQSIYDCLKVQHGQILITLLLQHAEVHHSVTVKAQIFMTTIQFFTESTGYFMQILDLLVKHMVSSVEFTAQDQQVVDNDNAHLMFQNEMITCLGVLCSKISHQQKLDAFSALCSKLSTSKHVSSSGLSGVVVMFARAILQVTQCTLKFPVDLLVPYLRLFQELSMHSSNDVRIFVQKIFQSVLMPQVELQQSDALNVSIEPIHEQVATIIRGTLYFQIKMRMKHAENYVAIFETLRAMLFKGGKYDLVESFPLVFSIQKFATKWKKIPPIRAYTIHTMVAVYLYCVAFMFHCNALTFHIDEVIQERDKKGHTCSLVSIHKSPIPNLVLASSMEYSVAPQKKVAVEYTLFDRQTIVDILCTGGNSTLPTEKRFPKVLMKKFRNQSDTITIQSALSPVESTYFHAQSSIATVVATKEDNIELPNASKSLQLLSPDQNAPLSASPEKATSKSSRIDIMSMKRALVVGVPSQIPQKNLSYHEVVENCIQKVQSNQLAILYEPIHLTFGSVFDMNLLLY